MTAQRRPPRAMAWVVLLASAVAVLLTGVSPPPHPRRLATAGSRSPDSGSGSRRRRADDREPGLRSLRWVFLLRRAETRIPIRDAYIGYFAGLSLLLAPLLLGEIAVRAAVLRARGKVPVATIVVVNLWERFLDVAALGVIAGGLGILLVGVDVWSAACWRSGLRPLVKSSCGRAALAADGWRGRSASVRRRPGAGPIPPPPRATDLAGGARDQRRGVGASGRRVLVRWRAPGTAVSVWRGRACLRRVRRASAVWCSRLAGSWSPEAAARSAPAAGLGGAAAAPCSASGSPRSASRRRSACVFLLRASAVARAGGERALRRDCRRLRRADSRVATPRAAGEEDRDDARRHRAHARGPAGSGRRVRTGRLRRADARAGIRRQRHRRVGGAGRSWPAETSGRRASSASARCSTSRRPTRPTTSSTSSTCCTIWRPSTNSGAPFAELLRVLRPGGLLFVHEINTRNVLFRFYMGYVFPSLNCIDEGVERWLLPHRFAVYTDAPVAEVRYFTFLPDFLPQALVRLLMPIERLLERRRSASVLGALHGRRSQAYERLTSLRPGRSTSLRPGGGGISRFVAVAVADLADSGIDSHRRMAGERTASRRALRVAGASDRADCVGCRRRRES